MPFSMVKDPLSPNDLQLLQHVFDTLCFEHHLSRGSSDAEALAVILVRHLQNGMRGEDALAAVGRGVMHHT